MSGATVYLAPVGESMPDIVDTPAGNWSVLGTNGDDNYDEAGITITHSQTLVKKRTLGGTGPR